MVRWDSNLQPTLGKPLYYAADDLFAPDSAHEVVGQLLLRTRTTAEANSNGLSWADRVETSNCEEDDIRKQPVAPNNQIINVTIGKR